MMMNVGSAALARAYRSCCAALIAALLAGCGGGMPSGTVTRPAGGHGGAATASVVITIPLGSRASSTSARRPLYVSPATSAAKLTTTPSASCTTCSSASTLEVALDTAPGDGCTVNGSVETCTIPLNLLPGTYTGALTLYDGGLNASGHVWGQALSTNPAFTITIAPGNANVVSVALTGIPSRVGQSIVTPASMYSVTGVAGNGSLIPVDRIIGAGANAQVTLVAQDWDGDAITGPSAASGFSVAFVGSSAGYSASVSGSTLTVTAPAAYTSATATISVTATAPGCAYTTANCTQKVRIGMAHQIAVADAGNNTVTVWTAGASAPSATITAGISSPVAVTFAPNGTLFVANAASSAVLAFAPPYTGTPTTLANGITAPAALATDAASNVYVSSTASGMTKIYAPPYTTATPGTMSTGGDSLAFDAAGDLWMAGQQSISRFAPPFAGASPVTSLTLPSAPATARVASIALDPNNVLFAADNANSILYRFDPPYTGAPSKTASASPSSGVKFASPTAVAVSITETLLVGSPHGGLGVGLTGPPPSILGNNTSPQLGTTHAIVTDGDAVAWVATQVSSGPVGVAYPYEPGAMIIPFGSGGVFSQPNAIAVAP
jgi:hypothetical protein